MFLISDFLQSTYQWSFSSHGWRRRGCRAVWYHPHRSVILKQQHTSLISHGTVTNYLLLFKVTSISEDIYFCYFCNIKAQRYCLEKITVGNGFVIGDQVYALLTGSWHDLCKVHNVKKDHNIGE